VEQFQSLIRQHSTDQQLAVARQRILFAAKQSNPVFLCSFADSLNAVSKGLALGELLIKDVAFRVIERGISWTPTQLLSHEQVFLTDRREFCC